MRHNRGSDCLRQLCARCSCLFDSDRRAHPASISEFLYPRLRRLGRRSQVGCRRLLALSDTWLVSSCGLKPASFCRKLFNADRRPSEISTPPFLHSRSCAFPSSARHGVNSGLRPKGDWHQQASRERREQRGEPAMKGTNMRVHSATCLQKNARKLLAQDHEKTFLKHSHTNHHCLENRHFR